MSFLRRFTLRLLGLFGKGRDGLRLEEELGSHFDLLVEASLANGMPLDQARAAARRTLGNEVRIGQEWREQRGLPWLEAFFQDIRHGLRMMRKNPGFAAVAIVTLALGIGANTAIFSVVDAVLLHPLPYRHPSRLVAVWQKNENGGWNQFPTPSYLAWQKQTGLFSGIAASAADSFVLSLGDRSERIPGSRVTASYFSVLGVQPFLGRPFLPEEDVPGGRRVVLLSYGLWQRLGGEPGIVGRSLTLDGAAAEVIGVLPAGFRAVNGSPELWLPLRLDPSGATGAAPGLHWLLAVARLRSGASLPQTQARIDALAPGLANQYPQTELRYGAALQSLTDSVVGGTRPTLLLLLVVAGLVLVIACVNVVNLLLARSGARSREMAIRAALGAGPRRIARQLIAEGLVLAAAGGVAAVALTWLAMPVLLWLGSLAALPRLGEIALDARLLTFAALVALSAGALFSLWPAREALRCELTDALKLSAGSAGTSPRRRRGRGLLIVWEIAMATVLLAAAGLLLRSFVALLEVPAGFDASHLATMKVSVPAAGDSSANLQAFRERLLAAASGIPGVLHVALARDLPYSGVDPSLPFFPANRAAPLPAQAPPVRYRLVSPGYFQTLGIPLLAGRDFRAADGPRAPCVAIVSQSLARQTWAEQNPVGRVVQNGYPGRPSCVVAGVVADVKHWLGVPDEATAYYAYSQLPAPLQGLAEGYVTVVAQTASVPSARLGELRSAVQAAAPSSPIFDVATMDQSISRAETARSFALLLVGAFAVLALVLGVVGVYGVLACSVSERTREFSIRLALGAVPGQAARLVVAEGLRLTLAGVAPGLAAALALARFLSSQLFGVQARDPLTFAAVGLLLVAIAALTSYLPARRATRLDPAVVLRSE